MTIIFQSGNFWIESFQILQASLGATSTRTTNEDLERSGTFLGCSVQLTGADAANRCTSTYGSQSGGAQIIVGTVVNDIRIFIRNDTAGALTIGATVLIFMRGSGH